MSITREKIISRIKDALQEIPHVHALWLEGSDALGCTDQFSDIDFVADVEDGHEGEIFSRVEETLLGLGELDLNVHERVNHPKILQKLYHLKGSSEYLIIDFNIQSHSRDPEESTFIIGDIVEGAMVLFDKSNVVSLKEDNFTPEEIKEELQSKITEFKSRYQQHSRVIKYVKRNLYLEAYIYYMKFVVDPLVQLLRFKYTPKHHYMYLIHISNHIPEQDRFLLEGFYRVSSLDDISKMTEKSKAVFAELVQDLEEKFEINITANR